MRAIAMFANGERVEVQHADGFAFTNFGSLCIINKQKAPIVMFAPGTGAIIFPDHDTELLVTGGLFDPSGGPVNLKA